MEPRDEGDSVDESISLSTNPDTKNTSKNTSYVAVAVLCYVNMLIYMERHIIAGVLTSIQEFFRIGDATAGLIQTVFICIYMLSAPVFGYLGDRYNRKLLLMPGMVLWFSASLGGAFVSQSHFWLLMLMRGLAGCGEASYTTIAPTIIGDLFNNFDRTLMISIFYVFITVGGGFGFILAAGVATATGDWRWSLTIIPCLGALGLLLTVFLVPNPIRGASESHAVIIVQTSYLEDIKYLFQNWSFIWSTLGTTTISFLTGALSFWTSTLMSRARIVQGSSHRCTPESCDPSDSFIFGAITMMSGVMGVLIGALLSKKLRKRKANADPLICAVAMYCTTPCFIVAFVVPVYSITATYVLITFGELLLAITRAIIADMLLYVVVPTRRATAESIQILVCHILGDAGSPYLIGIISDVLSQQKTDHLLKFQSLQYSILICPFAGILGGIFFHLNSLYIVDDRESAERLSQGESLDRPRRAKTSAVRKPSANVVCRPSVSFDVIMEDSDERDHIDCHARHAHKDHHAHADRPDARHAHADRPDARHAHADRPDARHAHADRPDARHAHADRRDAHNRAKEKTSKHHSQRRPSKPLHPPSKKETVDKSAPRKTADQTLQGETSEESAQNAPEQPAKADAPDQSHGKSATKDKSK